MVQGVIFIFYLFREVLVRFPTYSPFVGARGLCDREFVVPAENADNKLDFAGRNDFGVSCVGFSVVRLVGICRGGCFDLQLLGIEQRCDEDDRFSLFVIFT